jgi:hypothetical protein
MMTFARKVARGPFAVAAADVEELKKHGFSDAEVFDIAATVSARAFWTGIVESLGVEPEPPFHDFAPEFRKAMTVGRPFPKDANGNGASAPPANGRLPAGA